jgi:hypothetical protein
MLTKQSFAAFTALLVAFGAAFAAEPVKDPYEPYEWLIGEWIGGPEASPPTLVERFRWDANRAYIWNTTSLLQAEGEHLHFEGMMAWNAANRNFDYLFVVEPGSKTQERGVYRIDGDMIVRDVTLTGADGRTGEFRQIFRRTGGDTAFTSVMRKTADGWAPTFPGSEALYLKKRQ